MWIWICCQAFVLYLHLCKFFFFFLLQECLKEAAHHISMAHPYVLYLNWAVWLNGNKLIVKVPSIIRKDSFCFQVPRDADTCLSLSDPHRLFFYKIWSNLLWSVNSYLMEYKAYQVSRISLPNTFNFFLFSFSGIIAT